ncbi:MAG TPA: DUF979 domain-containing protein [Gemmatimonas sp.]|nr:DUF979 domain-containing protein [Gemmatimonas sp.]
MISLELLYRLMGVLVGGVAIVNLVDRTNPRRWRNSAFWGIYAVTFLVGSYLTDRANGFLVIAMVVVASLGMGQGKSEGPGIVERVASAARWGNRLFIPVLIIPFGTLLGTFLFKGGTVGGYTVMDPKQVTPISLGLSTLLALIVGVLMLRPRLSTPIVEARRLMDSVGWAAVLPQSLAALGAVFAAAGVGTAISTLAGDYLPLGSPFAVVAAYGIGMALFTMIMGNAFAAFPVMTAGIGLPLVVGQFGGDVVAMSAIGMLSGFCGTLMTPMAANFNIVPAALLEMRDRYGVIKAQIPTGLMLLAANIVLMYVFVYRAR